MEKSPDRNDPESSKSSTSSDQEVDQPADYVATGRSYECVFCKRGFTTAQALGGHMNIHRKDRAKNRPVGPAPTSIHSNNHHHQQFNYHTSPINKIYSHHPVSGYVPPQYNYYPYDAAALREPQHDNYRTYFPASTSDGGSRIPQFGDDWRVNMSMQFGGLARGEGEEEDKGGDEEDDDDDELDLELRLGHNP
ncbi:hypothetical protein Vadar_025836 [Vaccinium darrowii]|uniref:Uncharacterized protein n=1 Tax=Vaccinium darrowii TaxID=229202 RepID=A0ACB7ZEB8_9ERIC|nr:hypothetical protein Vadar_025836 [Vaccinium darrowii]